MKKPMVNSVKNTTVTYFDIEKVNLLINQQLNFIKHNYINNDGCLSSNYPPDSNILTADLNDLIPFLIEFNEVNFAKELTSNHLKNKDNYNYLNLFANRFIYTWRIDEWLGALFRINKLDTNIVSNDLLEKIIRFIFFELSKNKYLTGVYDTYNRVSFDFFVYQSMSTAEVLLENKDFFVKNNLETELKEWIHLNVKKALNLKFIKKNNLNPTVNNSNFYNTFIKPYDGDQLFSCLIGNSSSKDILSTLNKIKFSNFNTSQLMKSNTNFIFFLIEIKKQFPEIFDMLHLDLYIRNWIESVPMRPDGPAYSFTNGKILSEKSRIALSQNFAYADTILDYLLYVNSNPDYLLKVKNICDFFLSIKNNDLIPNDIDDPNCHGDSLIDFSITLMRLSTFLNNDIYYKQGVIILNNYLNTKKYLSDTGYYTYLNSISNTHSNVIYPKYNCLILKPLYIFKSIHQNQYDIIDLFKNTAFIDNIKDR